MRQGQQNNKRMRGRNRKGPNPLSRSYESNGPDVKVRGTALHIAEKYMTLARDAQSSGDRVAAENYLQHAEHYYRVIAAAQAQMPQPQPVYRNDGDDESDGDEEDERSYGAQERERPRDYAQQSFGPSDPQPYVNGNGGHAEESASEDEAGEAEANGEAGHAEAGPEQEAGAFRNRRRRSSRSRGRRPEGEAAGQPAEAVPSED